MCSTSLPCDWLPIIGWGDAFDCGLFVWAACRPVTHSRILSLMARAEETVTGGKTTKELVDFAGEAVKEGRSKEETTGEVDPCLMG